MSHKAILELKYRDVKEAIVEGKIVTKAARTEGSLSPSPATSRFGPDRDRDNRRVPRQCIERQRRGDFGGTYVHFHQRNLMDEIFAPDSIDTTLCNSTTHELWSTATGEDSGPYSNASSGRLAEAGG